MIEEWSVLLHSCMQAVIMEDDTGPGSRRAQGVRWESIRHVLVGRLRSNESNSWGLANTRRLPSWRKHIATGSVTVRMDQARSNTIRMGLVHKVTCSKLQSKFLHAYEISVKMMQQLMNPSTWWMIWTSEILMIAIIATNKDTLGIGFYNGSSHRWYRSPQRFLCHGLFVQSLVVLQQFYSQSVYPTSAIVENIITGLLCRLSKTTHRRCNQGRKVLVNHDA